VSSTVRNVAIVLLLAAAVFLLPGGGTGAAVVGGLLSAGFGVAIWLILLHVYRTRRLDLLSLSDRYRAILYASLAALLFAGAAASEWWDSGPLTLAWFAVVGAAVAGLVATWRHWREHV
jgi:hypothetical protein